MADGVESRLGVHTAPVRDREVVRRRLCAGGDDCRDQCKRGKAPHAFLRGGGRSPIACPTTSWRLPGERDMMDTNRRNDQRAVSHRRLRRLPVVYGSPYTTIWLAADPPGHIGDFMPVATPIR